LPKNVLRKRKNAKKRRKRPSHKRKRIKLLVRSKLRPSRMKEMNSTRKSSSQMLYRSTKRRSNCVQRRLLISTTKPLYTMR